MLKLTENSIVKIFIILTLIIFSFVGVNVHDGFMGIVVPHFEMAQVLIHSLFLFLFLALFLLMKFFHTKPVKFDLICGCLFIKCLFDLLPLYNGSVRATAYFQFYMCTVVSLVVYFVIINTRFTDNDLKSIRMYLIIFSFVLGCEVCYTFLKNPIPYGQPAYKMNMVVPYGGSNVIASALVPILSLLYLSKIKKPVKYFSMGFVLLAVFLTCSRGGLLLAFMTLFFLFFFCSKNKKNMSLKRLAIILIVLSAAMYFFASEELLTLFRLVKTGNSTGSILQYLSNGRFELWMNSFSEMDEKLFFGIGMYPDKYSMTGLHNIVLDIILRCGVFGAINYFIMFAVLIKRGFHTYKVTQNPYFVMVCIVYVNSLFELSYFYYNTDTMLWLYVGLVMSAYYRRKAIHSESV